MKPLSVFLPSAPPTPHSPITNVCFTAYNKIFSILKKKAEFKKNAKQERMHKIKTLPWFAIERFPATIWKQKRNFQNKGLKLDTLNQPYGPKPAHFPSNWHSGNSIKKSCFDGFWKLSEITDVLHVHILLGDTREWFAGIVEHFLSRRVMHPCCPAVVRHIRCLYSKNIPTMY